MRNPPVSISSAEMEILHVLWKHGPLTAREVKQRLSSGRERSYSTIITLLQRMEVKGSVTHQKGEMGKAFVFSPAVKPEVIQRHEVQVLLKTTFHNNVVALFESLLKMKKITSAEKQRIQAILDQVGKK